MGERERDGQDKQRIDRGRDRTQREDIGQIWRDTEREREREIE